MFARALPEYAILTAASRDELLRIGSESKRPVIVIINAKSAPVKDPWVQGILENVKEHVEEAPVVLLSDRDDARSRCEALSYSDPVGRNRRRPGDSDASADSVGR
jgi:hypothetical protein